MSRAFLLVGALLISSGCGTLPNGHRWGDDATLTPGWSRVGRAAGRALLEPGTWLPAAGAAVFAIDHFDRKVSNWAVRETPIFGSPSSANSASDVLYGVSAGAFAASFFATPSGSVDGDWAIAKLKAAGVEGGSLLATEGTVEVLKAATGRRRPNGRGHSSFPSGHATNAFALATLTSRNLESIQMPEPARVSLQAGAYTLAAATAWARVEAQKHFPSDVLAGAAIAHFLNAFVHDAFLGLPEDGGGMTVSFEPEKGGGIVEIGWTF